ncbi:MAG: hypothetical protein EXS36_06655 [Pedosphaera sp.]|nr:hypothetical protein [Pedosphaera sp.]
MQQKPRDHSGSRAPFHPLSATLLLVVDNLWTLEEWLIVTWLFTIPLSFVSVFLPVLCIQRFVSRDRWSIAVKKALFLGIVAAVPTSITGTPVGLALLAWAGLSGIKQ